MSKLWLQASSFSTTTPGTIGDIPYDFIDGRVVKYRDLPKLLFFKIVPDMLNMINDIVCSQDVSRHHKIINPGA
jgi:hypothetical protein